jgi:hypothetical protein
MLRNKNTTEERTKANNSSLLNYEVPLYNPSIISLTV